MSHSVEEVASRFAEQRINKRQGSVEWKTSTRHFYCKGRFLYSFGTHFIVAIYMGEDTDGKKIFLKNADRYSSDTSRHQAAYDRVCEGPSVSFNALNSTGIRLPSRYGHDNENTLKRTDLIDWTKNSHATLYRKDGVLYKDYALTEVFQKPSIGAYFEYGGSLRPDTPYDSYGYWHVVDSLLIHHQGEAYLCAVDEGIYFVSQLEKGTVDTVKTVADAFESLKPPEVKQAERMGIPVKRQGDWFFIQRYQDDDSFRGHLGDKTKKAFIERFSKIPLVGKRNTIASLQKGMSEPEDVQEYVVKRRPGNQHEPSRTIYLFPDGSSVVGCHGRFHGNPEGATPFVNGNVFHRRANGELSGEHRTVRCDGWWQAVMNTEQISFSRSGSID
jgi:hypothetical protein